MPSTRDIAHMELHISALANDNAGRDADIFDAAQLVREYLVAAPVNGDDILVFIEGRATDTRVNDPNARRRGLGATIENAAIATRTATFDFSPFTSLAEALQGRGQ